MAALDFYFKAPDAVEAVLQGALREVLDGGFTVRVGQPSGGWCNVAVSLARPRRQGPRARAHLLRFGVLRGFRRGLAPLEGVIRGHVLVGPPVVMLDFDGVVARVIDRPRLDGEPEAAWLARQARPLERMDPAAAARLNRLVALGAAFVVCSSWRTRDPKSGEVPHPPDKLQGYLECAGGFTGRVVGVTPEIEGAPRWREIEAWVDAQPVPPAALVILDDWPMGPLSARHVMTDYDDRLTDADVERAVRILRAQLGPQKGARRDTAAIPPAPQASPPVARDPAATP